MQISNRAQSAPQSPIRKLVPFTEAAEKKGLKVYRLNIGQPDFGIPKEIKLELKKQSHRQNLPYAPSGGVERTRQAWANYYQQVGIDCNAGDLIVTTGGTEAIMLAFWTLLDVGDELIVFEPSYANYNGYAVQTGVKIIPITTLPENGFHLPKPYIIEKAITPRTKAIMVTNPNNPTGTVLTPEELDLIIEMASKRNLMIIADETYRGIIFDNRPNPSIFVRAKNKKQTDRVVIIDSLSKRLNVCGARLGAFATTNKPVLEAAHKLAQNRLSVATLDQEIVTPMLVDCLQYVKEISAEYQKRRDLLFHLFESEPNIKLTKPEGAFYTFLTLPINGEKFAKWLLTDFESGGETVMVAPGAGFYFQPHQGENQIRVAYVLETSLLKRAAELLIQGLRKARASSL